MSSFKKAFRSLGGAALLLTCSLAASRPAEAAPPPRVWMPLQSNGPEWQDGMLQPLVDATIVETEYANGIKADLNDFDNDVPNGNGRLFLAMSDDVSFTSQKCRKPDSKACEGGTLFLGLQVHASTPAIGDEWGAVIVYIDTDRQKTLDHQSCSGTAKPGLEDRKILVVYNSQPNQAQLALTVKESRGDCKGWVDITPPNDPMLEAWPFKASGLEVPGANGVPSFLTFEISITSEPPVVFPSNPIVDQRLFGLGVLHIAHSGYGSFGHFPSVFNKKPADLDTLSWATMDLAEPSRIDLAMTAYNVGLLQSPAPDGGQGEAKDFAKLTYKNDVICMVEQMDPDKRDEVVVQINTLRAAAGLDPMTPIYPGDGEAPNNMILAAGPIMDAGWVLYGDLPEVSAYCGEEFDGPFNGGECLGAPEGYKGILWARIGVKKSKAVKGGKPQTWFGDHFVDVFCTHTQADYEYDGEFSNSQWCYDAFGSAAVGKHCVKSAASPMANPWQANLRAEQWKALKSWSHKKRSGGHGLPNGLDRPAFVLGDLNQIGPKAVTFDQPNQDVDSWMTATSGTTGFGTEYKTMRQELGTWPLSQFDQANGWAWDLYDLMARDKRGTWIGNGTESAVPLTSADECITGSQFPGYDTVTELPKEARVDYILVLPAEGSFPYYSITGPSAHPEEPEVAIAANAGSWTDGLGCASDHAQVSARIGLVQTGVKANYNPQKQHKVIYRVSHLWDFNNADGGDTDWMVQNKDFEMQLLDSFNALIDSQDKGYSDDSTPDGVAVSVDWHDSFDAMNLEKVRMGVWVTDSDSVSDDDIYDGNSFGSGCLGPHFEFDHAYPGTFRSLCDFDTVNSTLLGTADPSSGDPDGSCAQGCIGVVTEGDGEGADLDEDVQVTQSIVIEEIN